MVDDTTLDKPYARNMDLVPRHWSGKHKRVVQGINLISLLRAQGEERLPCDFRIYNRKEDGLTKNDHFGLAIRAFLRLEVARLQRGVTWFEAKHSIIRDAVRHYLAHPTLVLQPTA